MNDAKSSASFVSALGAFSQSLASSGIAIYGIEYDFLHFGSWTIELGSRHSRSLLQWDGKESLMSLSESDVADSQAPRNWRLVAEEPVLDRSTPSQVFAAAEKMVTGNVGT